MSNLYLNFLNNSCKICFIFKILIFFFVSRLKTPNENKSTVQTFLDLWNSYNFRDSTVANRARLHKAIFFTKRILFQRKLKFNIKIKTLA